MIEKIIDLSVKHKFTVVVTIFLLSIASFWAIKNIPLDALPDLSPPQVIVQINWSGQPPKVIEDQVTFPLVSAFMSISDIEISIGLEVEFWSNYRKSQIQSHKMSKYH